MSTPSARSGVATRERIVAAVDRLTQDLGRFPTPPEVEADLGMKHPTLHRHVTILEDAGILRRVYGGRGLEVLRPNSAEADRPARHADPQEAIRLAIQARIDVGNPCPTLDELASYLHINVTTARRYVRRMIRSGSAEYHESTQEVKRQEICLILPPEVESDS